MVISNLDLVRVAVVPDETDAPLIVDTDTELAPSVEPKGLQVVPGRNPKIDEANGVVQHAELSAGRSLDILR